MKKQPDMLNAVIYARYSSHNQTEQSIEGQLHDCHEYADRNGYRVIGEYIDRALTGTKDDRPDFQRMIKDAEKRLFQIIIVWKLDRFARNRYDSAIYKAKLKKYDVRVVSAKEAITDGPEGIILEGLLESMAEYYSANLSQNVKRGLRESADKGLYCGGVVPYGYKNVNQKLVRDDKTAPIIKYVFEEYAKGTPKKDIISELNRRGIRNRNGNPLTMTSFQQNLRMPTYCGEHMYGGQTIPDLAEPIVSREVFDLVQARLDKAARAPAAGKARIRYLLQGKIFCGSCGSPMFGESGKSHTGVLYTYYACRNKKKLHTCKKKNEKKVPLEEYVLHETMRYVLTPANIDQISAGVVREYNKEFSDGKIDEIKKAISQIDAEMEKLVDALIEAPKVAHAKIYARMEVLESQKSEYEIDLAKLQVANGIRLTEKEVKAWLESFRSGNLDDPDFCRKIIDSFINCVYVYDEKIVIFYNIVKGSGGLASSNGPGNKKESIPDNSDMDLSGRASPVKSEPITHAFIFLRGILGLVIFRKPEVKVPVRPSRH